MERRSLAVLNPETLGHLSGGVWRQWGDAGPKELDLELVFSLDSAGSGLLSSEQKTRERGVFL